MTHLGALVALGFLAVSAIINFQYGMSLGGALYATVGVLAVMASAACPFFAQAAHAERRWAAFYAAAAFWALCILYTSTNAVGYATEKRYRIETDQYVGEEIIANERAILRELELRPNPDSDEIIAQRLRLNGLLERLAPPDPQITSLSLVTGADRDSVLFAVSLLFAVLLETGAALGLFLALSARAPKLNEIAPIWRPAIKGDARKS